MQQKTLVFISLLYAGWLPSGILDKSEPKCVTGYNHINQSSEASSRQKRFLSFNNEEGSLKIELNFAIPFIHIPIGGKNRKVANSKEGYHPVIDVNTKSLVTAGAFVFSVLFVIPKLLKYILPQSTGFSKRSDSNTEFGRLAHDIESVMAAMNINAGPCWQRTVCSTIQASSKKVNERHGSSWDMIIDGIARNDLFHSMIQGTSTSEAVISGLKNNICSLTYKTCNLNVKDILLILQKLSIS